MRKIIHLLAWLAPLSLIGGSVVYSMQDVVKPSYASEIADQEIAALNKAAPKFPRKALLPADAKLLLDRGHGSAVSIGGNLWLTAAHVVANPSKRLDLRMKDGSIRPAEILWMSKERDISLLKANSDGVSSARLNCGVPAIGDEVTMAGNPVALENIVAFGRVAGDERAIGHWKSVIVISGPIIPGQSGGAVYNQSHELIGISVGLALFPVGYSGSATGYGFAVPGRTLCELTARV